MVLEVLEVVLKVLEVFLEVSYIDVHGFSVISWISWRNSWITCLFLSLSVCFSVSLSVCLSVSLSV